MRPGCFFMTGGLGCIHDRMDWIGQGGLREVDAQPTKGWPRIISCCVQVKVAKPPLVVLPSPLFIVLCPRGQQRKEWWTLTSVHSLVIGVARRSDWQEVDSCRNLEGTQKSKGSARSCQLVEWVAGTLVWLVRERLRSCPSFVHIKCLRSAFSLYSASGA